MSPPDSAPPDAMTHTSFKSNPPQPALGTDISNGPNVALIGGGMIAEQHLRSLTQGCADLGLNLIGICDLSPALAKYRSKCFNIPYWTTDHRDLLDDTAANILHVLTPAKTHVPIVRECLERGRHVIVEKPIALSNADFGRIWSLAKRGNLYLTECHNYRFNAPVLRIDRMIEQGRLGTIEEAEIRCTLNIRHDGRYADSNMPHPSHALPAGVIHEFISHLSYLLLHFLDADPQQADGIRAAWRNHGGNDLFKYDDLDALVIFGNRHGRIRFRAQGWPNELSIHLRGSEGIVMAELFQHTFQFVAKKSACARFAPLAHALAGASSLAMSGCSNVLRKVKNQTPYEGLTRFLHQTYSAIKQGTNLPVEFEDMDRTTRFVDALLEPEHQL